MTEINQSPAEKATLPAHLADLTLKQRERMQAFKDVRVKHPALVTIIEDLMPLLSTVSDTNVIVVTGATGVGKSTLSKVMLQQLIAQFSAVTAEDASAIPLVYTEATRNGSVRNGFGRLYQQVLDGLEDPGKGSKIPHVKADGRIVLHPRSRATADDLREVMEEALVRRKTRVVVVDEAAHLARFGKGEDVMDTVKSLANTTNTKWLLVGSFDLLDVVETSGQIARRTTIINMERYHSEKPEDKEAFKRVVRALQSKWPCDSTPDFSAISDALMDVSLGCVGLLKTILLDAANLQIRNGGVWKADFLRKATKSNGLREIIRKEIEAGELKVQDAVYGNSFWNDATLEKLAYQIEPTHAV